MTLALALIAVLLAFDLQNLIARFKHAVPLSGESSSDYTLIVPLFGRPDVLTNLDFLCRWKPNVLLVLNTTNEAMMVFADAMESTGWRVHRTAFLEARPRVSRLWQAGLDAVSTTYAIRFDADTVSPDDPGRAIRALELSGGDYASAKVLAKDPRRMIQHLQAAEYAMSMQARHFRPWMTSGACIMGRTEALRAVLAMHTHWWNGEDVEQGIIAKHYRMSVKHIDYHVYTDVPGTVRALFKQRKLWWAGSVRQTLVNVDQMVWFPAYIFYNLVLVYAGFLLRGRFLASSPLTFLVALPLTILVYVAITSIANYKVWSRWFLIFPLYGLVQACVMPGVGVFVFARTAYQHRSSGRYLIRWRRERWTTGRTAV
jgi:cellulose synthase/poly-beta-1,6-N-acetylglucosamine synthase-like glycosyltransferase